MEIKIISQGGVNCYLIKTGQGFFLIDTGFSKNRAEIEADLKYHGCAPGDLKLIILTHGDFDHAGNAAYLRQKYGVKIALHPADVGMVENGDLFYSRKANLFMKSMGKLLLVLLKVSLKEADRFTPDLKVEDGFDLSSYGLEAKLVHVPGHSQGSIGILTATGDFFCGDLLENKKRPAKGALIPDKAGFKNSIQKISQLKIGTVYPGHGAPFRFNDFKLD